MSDDPAPLFISTRDAWVYQPAPPGGEYLELERLMEGGLRVSFGDGEGEGVYMDLPEDARESLTRWVLVQAGLWFLIHLK